MLHKTARPAAMYREKVLYFEVKNRLFFNLKKIVYS